MHISRKITLCEATNELGIDIEHNSVKFNTSDIKAVTAVELHKACKCFFYELEIQF